VHPHRLLRLTVWTCSPAHPAKRMLRRIAFIPEKTGLLNPKDSADATLSAVRFCSGIARAHASAVTVPARGF
jgi:hypothetical protein